MIRTAAIDRERKIVEKARRQARHHKTPVDDVPAGFSTRAPLGGLRGQTLRTATSTSSRKTERGRVGVDSILTRWSDGRLGGGVDRRTDW